MSHKLNLPVATMGIDIGKNAFHTVGSRLAPRDHAAALPDTG